MRWTDRVTGATLGAAVAAAFTVAASAQVPKGEMPTLTAVHERAIAVDVVEFDPYWRDGCLTLAAALQPLADIAKQPPRPGSIDDQKRHDQAKKVATEIERLRAGASDTRKVRIVWVPTSESECRPLFIPPADKTAIALNELYIFRIGRATSHSGLMTRLRPIGTADTGAAVDIAAEAARVRGLWIAAEVDVCHSIIKQQDSGKRAGARAKSREKVTHAFALPPEWSEGADAIRALKTEVETARPGDARSVAATPEVTVRFAPPKHLDTVSRVAFNLHGKKADGTRGEAVNGDTPLVAWGYAGRPAMLHVPVKELCADGYEVDVVEARYR